MHFFVSILCVLPWALSLAAEPAVTGGGEGALSKLRAEFESTLAQCSVEPLKLHISELQALEKKAAVAADWKTALVARDERTRAEAELATLEKVGLLLQTVAGAQSTQGIVSLKMGDAKLEGVKMDPTTGALIDWVGAGSHASWTLPGIPPGGYEVVLRYASSATQGGTLEVREAFYSLTADTKITLRGAEEHNLGTLRVRSGGGPLTVTATNVSKGGLMELAAVELRPVGD